MKTEQGALGDRGREYVTNYSRSFQITRDLLQLLVCDHLLFSSLSLIQYLEIPLLTSPSLSGHIF